jgi:hypothetical protein
MGCACGSCLLPLAVTEASRAKMQIGHQSAKTLVETDKSLEHRSPEHESPAGHAGLNASLIYYLSFVILVRVHWAPYGAQGSESHIPL